MGERSYEVSVDLSASSASVWALLGEVTSWPTWTPTVTTVRPLGDPKLSQGAIFEVKQPGLPKAKFTVESCVDGQSFRWSSHSNGVHSSADHVIESRGPNQCRVTLKFRITSRMVRVAWWMTRKKVCRFVDLEALSLKVAAEKNERRLDS